MPLLHTDIMFFHCFLLVKKSTHVGTILAKRVLSCNMCHCVRVAHTVRECVTALHLTHCRSGGRQEWRLVGQSRLLQSIYRSPGRLGDCQFHTLLYTCMSQVFTYMQRGSQSSISQVWAFLICSLSLSDMSQKTLVFTDLFASIRMMFARTTFFIEIPKRCTNKY